jgi:hypothetical protein
MALGGFQLVAYPSCLPIMAWCPSPPTLIPPPPFPTTPSPEPPPEPLISAYHRVTSSPTSNLLFCVTPKESSVWSGGITRQRKRMVAASPPSRARERPPTSLFVLCIFVSFDANGGRGRKFTRLEPRDLETRPRQPCVSLHHSPTSSPPRALHAAGWAVPRVGAVWQCCPLIPWPCFLCALCDVWRAW